MHDDDDDEHAIHTQTLTNNRLFILLKCFYDFFLCLTETMNV